MNFRFNNNYTICGITRIIYSIFVEDFLSTPTTFSKNIYEIGVEYKESSQSSWTKCIVKTSTDPFVDLNSISGDKTTHYVHSEYDSYYSYNFPSTDNFLYPIYVIIHNLTPNTQYNVRAYYIDDNGQQSYNEQTVTTKPRLQNRTVEWGGIVIDDSVYSYYGLDKTSSDGIAKAAEITQHVQDDATMAFDIINSMVNIDPQYNQNQQITFKILDSGNTYAGAMSPGGYLMELDIRYVNVADTLSIMVHELSHAYMRHEDLDEIYNISDLSTMSQLEVAPYDNIIKFMEFCTHQPLALWRWMGHHNYPVISSARYSYFYNYFVAAAWEVIYPQTE